MEQLASLIFQKLEAMLEAGERISLVSKREAICALLPYAIFLGQGGQQGMVNTIFRIARASRICWFVDPIGPYITTLFEKPSSPFLDWVITLASPHIDWESIVSGGNTVVRWAAAASAVPITEEVSQSVVDTLLQIASIYSLRQHIPIGIWAYLKRRPTLPPVCLGRSRGTTPDTVRHVRGLGDFEILKSYFLLVWSEWDDLCIDGLNEMEISIEEDFSGIWMWDHQEDMLNRLDYVLERLCLGLECLEQHNPQVMEYRIEAAQGQYGKLKEALLRVDRETVKTLARKPPNRVLFNKRSDSHGFMQNLIPPSFKFVFCLFRVCDHQGQFALLPLSPSNRLVSIYTRSLAFPHSPLALLELPRCSIDSFFFPFWLIMTHFHCNDRGGFPPRMYFPTTRAHCRFFTPEFLDTSPRTNQSDKLCVSIRAFPGGSGLSLPNESAKVIEPARWPWEVTLVACLSQTIYYQSLRPDPNDHTTASPQFPQARK